MRIEATANGGEGRSIAIGETIDDVVATSPNGRLIAGTIKDGRVLVWSAETGRLIRQLTGQVGEIHTLAFSHDGRSLFSGGRDGKVRMWELLTGTERVAFRPLGGDVYGIALSPDGRSLAAAGGEGVVRLLELPAGFRHRDAFAATLKELWEGLASHDGATADRAIGRLVPHGPDAVSLIRERVRPIQAPSAEKTAEMFRRLASRDYREREEAERELRPLAAILRPVLEQESVRSRSAEARARLEVILADLDREVLGSDQLREVRAVEVLEEIATPEARSVLERLGGGACGAPLTESARAALERLERTR